MCKENPQRGVRTNDTAKSQRARGGSYLCRRTDTETREGGWTAALRHRFDWVDEERHPEFHHGFEEQTQTRVIQLDIAHHATNLDATQSKGLRFLSHIYCQVRRLKRRHAETEKAVGCFGHQFRHRLVHSAHEFRRCRWRRPIRQRDRKWRDDLMIDA